MTRTLALLVQARERPPARPEGGTKKLLGREKELKALKISEVKEVLISQMKIRSGFFSLSKSLRARMALGWESPWQFHDMIFITIIPLAPLCLWNDIDFLERYLGVSNQRR